ncbi:MAG: hypothetical protein ACLUUO_09295 [Sellimonas intestinalis]
MVHEIIPVMIGEEETNARLYTYFWSNSKELYDGRRRPCVLICPGGGYAMTSDREGKVWQYGLWRWDIMRPFSAIRPCRRQYFQTRFYRRRPV